MSVNRKAGTISLFRRLVVWLCVCGVGRRAVTAVSTASWFSYPINNLNDPTMQQVLKKCQHSLSEQGIFHINKFLSSDAVSLLRERMLTIADKANKVEGLCNVFQDSGDVTNFEPEHHRNHEFTYMERIVSRSSLTSEFVDLYTYPPLLRFIEEIVTNVHHLNNVTLDCRTYEHLYLSESEEGSIYGMVSYDGDTGAWHFDESPFSCVWMLSPATDGGQLKYRYIPPTTNPNHTSYYDRKLGYDWTLIRKIIIDNQENEFDRQAAEEGDLYCFKGNITVHAVEPVAGNVARVVFVTAFADYPHFTHSPDVYSANNWEKDEL